MIRATFFLTLALTVATGESAMLICQAVCDHGVEADAEACRHAQSAVASMTEDGGCLSLELPATATLRVELDRPDPHGAAPVALSNEPLMTPFGRPFASAVFSLPSGSPPRTVALRI